MKLSKYSGVVFRGFSDAFYSQFDWEVTVRCPKCHEPQIVNFALCLREGWPSCCGQTMRLEEEGLKQ